MNRFVVVTGMSGAGRSVAGGKLEDLGWFVIDNLPASLVSGVAEMAHSDLRAYKRLALIMAPSGSLGGLPVERLRKELGDLTLLYLDASTETLLRRYKTTKRPHPFANKLSVSEAIEHERALLSTTKEAADIVIDTSDLNPYELGERLREYFADEESSDSMRITLTSFGFKYGLPLDVDMVFDCRFMPNPYWDKELRMKTGMHGEVQDYVLEPELSKRFVSDIAQLIERLLPAYKAEGKSYLTVGFGCTGGRHRSVTVAENIAGMLQGKSWPVGVSHRDIDR